MCTTKLAAPAASSGASRPVALHQCGAVCRHAGLLLFSLRVGPCRCYDVPASLCLLVMESLYPNVGGCRRLLAGECVEIITAGVVVWQDGVLSCACKVALPGFHNNCCSVVCIPGVYSSHSLVCVRCCTSHLEAVMAQWGSAGMVLAADCVKGSAGFLRRYASACVLQTRNQSSGSGVCVRVGFSKCYACC